MAAVILTKPCIERNFEAVVGKNEVLTLNLDAAGFPRNGMLTISCNSFTLVGAVGFRASASPICAELFNASSNFLVFHAPVLSFSDELSIDANDRTLTSSLAGSFDNHDVGSSITVKGAGAGGVDLITTIASVTGNATVELVDAAATAVSGAGGTKAMPPAPSGTTFPANKLTVSFGQAEVHFCNRFGVTRTIRAQFL